MMKKMLAGPMVAGALLLAPVAVAQASNAETTPPADEAAADEDDGDDDDSSKVGLLGSVGPRWPGGSGRSQAPRHAGPVRQSAHRLMTSDRRKGTIQLT